MPPLLIASVSLFAAVCQVVYIREYLSIFSGNEIVLGVILAVWLGATGAGSLAGGRMHGGSPHLLVHALLLSGFAGVVGIRACRLVLGPGEAAGPAAVLACVAATSAPAAFLGGAVFGRLSAAGAGARPLYGGESAGTAVGALLAYVAALLYGANGTMVCFAALPAIALTAGAGVAARVVLLAGVAGFVLSDQATVRWKYPPAVQRVTYGREAEVAVMRVGGDTTVLVNGALHRSTLPRPDIEQAVHAPLAQRPSARRALVIADQGHVRELARYAGLVVEQLESERLLGGPGAMVAAPETWRPAQPFDVVLLGAGLPRTTAANRFYTAGFFAKVKELLAPGGLFSFTLPLNTTYLSAGERELYAVVLATLRRGFGHVWVFPGEGYTFMASDAPIPAVLTPRVEAPYLSRYVVPGVTAERIAEANAPVRVRAVNTADHPLALRLAFRQWLEQYRFSVVALAALLAAALAASVLCLPRTPAAVSLGTSGFAAAIVSSGMLIAFQASHGTLYSQVSLMLIALTAGFALGSMLKKMWQPDLAIGLVACGALVIAAQADWLPQWAYLVLLACVGALCGGQFVCIAGRESVASRYAADVAGGLFGMAVGTTWLIPEFGVVGTAVGVLAVKVAAWGFSVKIQRSID